jgi:hypothetical protein
MAFRTIFHDFLKNFQIGVWLSMLRNLYSHFNVVIFTASLFLLVSASHAAGINGVSIYQPEKTFTAYLEKDVRVLEKNPVILRPGQYMKSGDVYLVDTSAAKNSPYVYLELVVDWIEPIELSAAFDQISVSSLVGEASALLPTATASEDAVPVEINQMLPVGTTIRVAAGGCVGLDIGGTHAVCLVPGTVAKINRNMVAGQDQIVVNLDSGAVFSHVNLQQQPTDFKVQTPTALAAARGTDFVTVALPTVTDVWIQEGSVELFQPDGITSVGTVSSDNAGSPKILRFPPAADELARIQANSLTFTVAATLIPQLNTNLPKLRAKQGAGEALTPLEQNIVDNAKQMRALVRVVALGSE